MRTGNRMLVSALLLLIASSGLIILGNHVLISAQEPAQETTPISTAATYNVESTAAAFEDSAKVARDSALELIEEAIQRPTEASNTTETANVEFTDEFGFSIPGESHPLKGATAASDYVKEILDNIIDNSIGNTTSLSFKMQVDTECDPDCLFKINLQK